MCYTLHWLIDWCLTPTLAIFQLYHGIYKFSSFKTVLPESSKVQYYNFLIYSLNLIYIRPCKINYLVLRYRCVGKKSAAVLYLSPNKNKYNSQKVSVQIFAPFNLNWSKRDGSNFTLKEFGTLLCFPLIVRSHYFR